MGGTLGAAGASIASAGSAVSQITGRNNNSFKGVLESLEVLKIIFKMISIIQNNIVLFAIFLNISQAN